MFSHKLKNAMTKLHLSAEALSDPASKVCMSQMEPVMVEPLCGSYDARSTCLTLSSSGSWEESHNLAKHRYWHTAWESPQGTILLGGEASVGATTEILLESGDTTPGFCLPYSTE